MNDCCRKEVNRALRKIEHECTTICNSMRPARTMMECENRECLGYACGHIHKGPHRQRDDCKYLCRSNGQSSGRRCVLVIGGAE